MTLKELLNLAQTDPTEALKEAFEMGSKWADGTGSSQECDYTEDQFMAFMDGAKVALEIEGDKLAKLNERITRLEVERIVIPKIDQPNQTPSSPYVTPFWWQNGPTCNAKSTDATKPEHV